jgi:hypothetical protein
MVGNFVCDNGEYFIITNVEKDESNPEIVDYNLQMRKWIVDEKRASGVTVFAKASNVKSISLRDDFFFRNDYMITKWNTEKNGECWCSIIRKDFYGPAITKRKINHLSDDNEVEYAVTGIIVRTVDEFQNLMNVCGCQDIANNLII